jgi:hypothetical protein
MKQQVNIGRWLNLTPADLVVSQDSCAKIHGEAIQGFPDLSLFAVDDIMEKSFLLLTCHFQALTKVMFQLSP